MKLENMIGKRFTRLTVIARAESNKHGHTKWICKCDCGKEIAAYASDLKRGGRPSCGCLKSEKISSLRKLAFGQAGLNSVYGQYRKSAKERKYSFSLTIEQFSNLIDKNCHYCGAGPTLKAFSEVNVLKNGTNGNFIYTGIDRKNSEQGYHFDNCVACCKTCNFAKNTMSYKKFMEHIESLVVYWNKKNKNQG